MAETKYNVMDEALRDVKCKLIDAERKSSKEHLEVLNFLITHMNNDEIFKYLYKKVVHIGSSYDQLKVNKAEELDVHILFVWPPGVCEVVYKKDQPGNVTLKLNRNEPSFKKFLNEAPSAEKKLAKWTDENELLLKTGFKYWMQGMITKAINCMPVKDAEQVKQRTTDYGFTIIIAPKPSVMQYSINLFPAFLFTDKYWPHPVCQLDQGAHSRDWTVELKETKSGNQPTYWRMSFYHQEEEIINNLPVMKDVLELIKLLCDHQNWSDLHSYAIKTLFLWECRDMKNKVWQTGLGNTFIHMLQKLSSHLTKGSVPYYWDSQLNLLDNMKDSTRININNRLCSVLKQVDANLTDNPCVIMKYFRYTAEEIEDSASHLPNIDNNFLSCELPTGILVNITDNTSQESVIHEHNPQQQKINEDVFSALGGSNKNTNDDTSQQVSKLTVELLTNILKEQREIKQVLQSMSEQYVEMSREINELREANAQLRMSFQSKTNENFFFTSLTSTPPVQQSLGVLEPHATFSPNSHLSSNVGSLNQQTPSAAQHLLASEILLPRSTTNNNCLLDWLQTDTSI